VRRPPTPSGPRVTVPPGAAERAFNTLYEGIYPSLWRYVNRLLGDGDSTDDVVQEAFVRILGKPDLTGSDARVWLFTVATNLVRDRGRTTARRGRLVAGRSIGPEAGPDPAETLDRSERVREVRAALEQLSERDRQMLLMREEGFSYQEIARAVGVAPGSVGTLVARATRRFTEAYGAGGT
jgi:RNA polymerase sigma-70 factor, ECF subfamily